MRLLLVDDDAGVRALLRTTFELVDLQVEEAESADEAIARIAQSRPDVVLLDVNMPGTDGIELCRALKANPATSEIGIVLLTGDATTDDDAVAAGAEALLRKPFSPLELLGVVERIAGGRFGVPFRAAKAGQGAEQLLLYARDLRHLLELERAQRAALQQAYHDTVAALASALETKDFGTRAHSQRVQGYAVELASALAPDLAANESSTYGFLLHDVGKIGIPDRILRKRAALTAAERRLMQTHTELGEQMLGNVAFLRGPGLEIVRSHHERWEGGGYPDGISGEEIPLGARIFSVADTLDAMTSDRPYRRALRWEDARAELLAESGKQFDPDVVDAFREREPALREIHDRYTAAV